MQLNLWIYIFGLALAFAVAGPVRPDDGPLGPGPSQLKIRSVSFTGTGCPPGTVVTAFAPDRSRLTVSFNAFRVEISPGLPISERTKYCQAHLALDEPDGWQFAVTESLWHGYARLEENVTATIFTTYYFSAAADATSSAKFAINGTKWASGDTFTIRQVIPDDVLVWSPCHSNSILNMNNRVSLTSSASNGHGYVGVDDIANVHQIGLVWRSC